MAYIPRKCLVRLLLATGLVLLLVPLGSDHLLAQQPDVRIETTGTLLFRFPQMASEPELDQQLAGLLTAAAGNEPVPYLRQAELSISQDAGKLRQIVNDVRTVVLDGNDATTTAVVFFTLQQTSAEPSIIGLLNIQSEPDLSLTTSMLAAHEAQHARINNELTRRLAPIIYATYKSSDQAMLTIGATLVRILHDGAVAFDTATDHGLRGDQEAEATTVIETVTQTATADLGLVTLGP